MRKPRKSPSAVTPPELENQSGERTERPARNSARSSAKGGAEKSRLRPSDAPPFDTPPFDTTVILNTMVDGAVIIDSAGTVLMFNDACERLFGYRRQEIIGRNVRMLMPSPYRDHHDDFIANYLRTGDRKIIGIGREVTGLRKDGTTFPMELAVGVGGAMDTRFFIGLIRDITERKRTETFIRESEQEMAAVIETAVDGMIIMDGFGTIRKYNHACEIMFGYEKSEVMARNIKMLMPSPYYDNHDRYLQNYRKTGKRKIIGIGREVTGRRKSGETFPIELSVGEIERGESRLFVGILRDISDRKRTEDVLRESMDATRRANQAKSDFLARVSHELRTPLNAILGFSEMMKLCSLGPLSDRYAEYAHDIHNAARHLHDLVSDLLDLSRIEGAGYAMTETVISVRTIINQALTYFNSKLNGFSHIAFVVDCKPALPYVKVDQRMIRQILTNLINNSVTAVGTDGLINIEATQQPSGDIVISVTDNGCGIDEERLETLFEPFSQTIAFVAIERHGSGLGLAISKGLVEMHGGRIWVDSIAGEGTAVSFSIPHERVMT